MRYMTKNWFANLEVYNLVIIVLLQFVVIKEVHISLIVLTGALYVATVLLYNIGATPTIQQTKTHDACRRCSSDNATTLMILQFLKRINLQSLEDAFTQGAICKLKSEVCTSIAFGKYITF